ncbi:hypothetical protein ACFL4B_00375 [Candidatus Neomarinimicrobiota bacterium]
MSSNIKVMLNRNKYWILVSLTYLTLIYSTSLHYAYGKERTIDLAFFIWEEKVLEEYYPDLGSLKEHQIDYNWRNIWKLSSFAWDCGYYLLQGEDLGSAIPPYKYRILPALIVKAISTVFQISVEMSFVLMNIIVIFLAALLFNIYLLKDFKFSELVSFIGGILFITTVSVTRTLPFPMLDPISMFFSILIFMAVIRRNPYLFLFSAIAGVMSKEILVVASLMWFLETLQLRDKTKLLKNFIICLIPLIVFISIRIALGGTAFEVEYGHNIFKGEFPEHGRRLFNIGGLLYIVRMVFLSFSFLWFGIINIRKHIFFKRQIIVIPIVILATVLLSPRVTRPLGILFPLVIPMFLMFFEKNNKTSNQIKGI